ncbi:D-alanine--D-serine ligase VanG [Fumia xinanensis]|uniref:D-alanine--D-alanine ligase n=1 Tax=Fumia xinanensis TaxID=2763659 RepID=A0A926I6K1_9FIRM|nr:D-alanine--D-serine ligase VanG [Fumia xinanensis]MBC8559980.1 D-alanine--D-serine ligase VanG [Fumia xinanensis]
MKNVLILFGGCSPEYNVSLQSAAGVIRSMDREKFTPVLVGISEEGDWYHFSGSIDSIADGSWQADKSCAPAALTPSRGERYLLVFEGEQVKKIPVDTVFPVLHGQNGEDGTVQGLCELKGIPVVGCGMLSSALCMDKDRAHKLAKLADVTVPRSFLLQQGFCPEEALNHADSLGYPLFVKPVKAGSSYGVAKVSKRENLLPAVGAAFSYDDEVIVEEAVPGFEVGCAVMGNRELVTGEIDEVELADGFFDFTEKYNLITSKIHVPARIPPEKSRKIKETAKTIYRALDCRGFARVDLFLTPSGEIVFNEVNTIPGFTAHSRFPSMMEAAGMPLKEVVTKAIELAVES